MKRSIVLRNYRNFGLNSGEEYFINRSMNEGQWGDLVILIGPNNSGKSNILSAISSLSSKKLVSNDITDFESESDTSTALIDLVCKENDEYFCNRLSLREGGSSTSSLMICGLEDNCRKFLDTDLESAKKEVSNVISAFLREDSGAMPIQLIAQLNSKSDLLKLVRDLTDAYKNNPSDPFVVISGRRLPLKKIEKDPADVLKEHPENYGFCLAAAEINLGKEAEEIFKEKNGISLVPNVVTYKDVNYMPEDLISSPGQASAKPFFVNLFKILGIENSSISKAYEMRTSKHNPAFVSRLEEKVNERINNIINKDFNRLYSSGDYSYFFSARFEASEIGFLIQRKGSNGELVPLTYSQQSDGFKWFFNFYFKTYAGTSLKNGDILILDEPATNLHPAGQSELRSFFKDLARRSGITIVMSTHSPFYIDPDYFEELRVVVPGEKDSHIQNTFSAVDKDDPNCLRPIKDALTIKQTVIYDNEHTVVWVEGLTDYLYLTAFKELLKEEKLYFLPFNGVGDKNDKKIVKLLTKQFIGYHFRNMVVLVDGDDAGDDFKNECKIVSPSIKVITIKDVFSGRQGMNEIENLFSSAERKKFPCLDDNSFRYKKAFAAASFKESIISKKETMSAETNKNFAELFSYIKRSS